MYRRGKVRAWRSTRSRKWRACICSPSSAVRSDSVLRLFRINTSEFRVELAKSGAFYRLFSLPDSHSNRPVLASRSAHCGKMFLHMLTTAQRHTTVKRHCSKVTSISKNVSVFRSFECVLRSSHPFFIEPSASKDHLQGKCVCRMIIVLKKRLMVVQC